MTPAQILTSITTRLQVRRKPVTVGAVQSMLSDYTLTVAEQRAVLTLARREEQNPRTARWLLSLWRKWDTRKGWHRRGSRVKSGAGGARRTYLQPDDARRVTDIISVGLDAVTTRQRLARKMATVKQFRLQVVFQASAVK